MKKKTYLKYTFILELGSCHEKAIIFLSYWSFFCDLTFPFDTSCIGPRCGLDVVVFYHAKEVGE